VCVCVYMCVCVCVCMCVCVCVFQIAKSVSGEQRGVSEVPWGSPLVKSERIPSWREPGD
jgi:hypothetical protein